MEFKDLPISIQEMAADVIRSQLARNPMILVDKVFIRNLSNNVRNSFTGLYSYSFPNNGYEENSAKKITEATAQNINTKPTEEEIDQFAHDAGLKNKKEKSPYAGNMFVYDNLIRIRGEIPTEYLARIHQALLKNLETEVFDGNTNGSFVVSTLAKEWDTDNRWNVATWLFSNKAAALEAAACICDLLKTDHKYNLDVYSYIYAEHYPLWISW
ncbi:Ybl81 [Escherichia coli]